MYERFYGFAERPFTLLPDPDFLFPSDKHRTALDLLELAIFNNTGFCVISGDIGAGKTTLIRELLNRLDERINVGLVSNTHTSFGELMQWVMAAYGLPVGVSDKLELHKRFIDYIIDVYAHNQHTLLIIDEAQNLSIDALEELRMLSNVNSDKDLVLQVILVGQQQLRARLKDPRLEQFAQRIALDYHLETLDQEETQNYIQHRLRHAGGEPGLFSDAACAAVYRVSHGIPRLINRVCDLCLVYGYSEERADIDADVVAQVAEDQRMGRLFGDQEAAFAADSRPVMLKAVGAQTPPAAAGTVPVAHTDAATDSTAGGDPADTDAGPAQTPEPRKCEPAHISPTGTGLTSETTDEAAEPHSSEEANMPVNKNKPQADTATAGSAAATQTVVDAMSAILLPDKQASGDKQQPSDDQEQLPGSADALHTLVVDAEQRQKARGERGALWLLVGVFVLVAGTGWMARDIWFNQAGEAVAPRQAAVPPPPVPGRIAREPIAADAPATPAAASVADTDVARTPPSLAANPPLPADEPPAPAPAEVHAPQPVVAAVAEPAPQPVAEPAAESPAQPPAAVEPALADVAVDQDAELRREAARLARLQEEAQRLEQERKAAELELARQRAARQALERKTRLEQERIRAAEKTVAKVAVDRARVEQQLNEVTSKAISVKVPPPAASTEQPADQAAGKPPVAASVAVFEPGKVERKEESVPVADAAEPVADENRDVRFSSNPCNGPSARFMSTCR